MKSLVVIAVLFLRNSVALVVVLCIVNHSMCRCYVFVTCNQSQSQFPSMTLILFATYEQRYLFSQNTTLHWSFSRAKDTWITHLKYPSLGIYVARSEGRHFVESHLRSTLKESVFFFFSLPRLLS